MINYWQMVYWGFDTVSLTENVSQAHNLPSSENAIPYNRGPLCCVKRVISYHHDLTCNQQDRAWSTLLMLTGLQVTWEIFEETHRPDLCCNTTNVTPVLLAVCKCFINS